MTNALRFYLKSVSLLLFKGNFAGYRILGYFYSLKSPHFLPASLSGEGCDTPPDCGCRTHLFPSGSFHGVCSCLAVMSPSKVFFTFILLGVH